MEKIVVVDEPLERKPSNVVSALEYLLSPQWSRMGGIEVDNRCTTTGIFSSHAYVDRFARARQHSRIGGVAPFPRAHRANGPLGILFTHNLTRHPSALSTLQHLERLAMARGIDIHWLQQENLEAVDELGALFIRDDTSCLNHTYAFSLRAAARGIPVIDRPELIEAATDKVLEAELFSLHGLPVPRTKLLHAGNVAEVTASLGYPFVLKRTDGSYGHEVWRIDHPDDLERRLPLALDKRLFAVAQSYRPSDFDWRVGILGGQVIFAARYHRVPGHWQMTAWQGDNPVVGHTEAVPLGELPMQVMTLAQQAAALLGDGFLGVDLKELDEGPVVIEVNDCVDVDVDYEDGVEGDNIYFRLLDALGYG